MRPRPNRTETSSPRSETGPLISTRTLVILVVAAIAAVGTALFPDVAIPIGVGVGVITLLAQIVRD